MKHFIQLLLFLFSISVYGQRTEIGSYKSLNKEHRIEAIVVENDTIVYIQIDGEVESDSVYILLTGQRQIFRFQDMWNFVADKYDDCVFLADIMDDDKYTSTITHMFGKNEFWWQNTNGFSGRSTDTIEPVFHRKSYSNTQIRNYINAVGVMHHWANNDRIKIWSISFLNPDEIHSMTELLDYTKIMEVLSK